MSDDVILRMRREHIRLWRNLVPRSQSSSQITLKQLNKGLIIVFFFSNKLIRCCFNFKKQVHIAKTVI